MTEILNANMFQLQSTDAPCIGIKFFDQNQMCGAFCVDHDIGKISRSVLCNITISKLEPLKTNKQITLPIYEQDI